MHFSASLAPEFYLLLNSFFKQSSTLIQIVSSMIDIQKYKARYTSCTHGIHNPTLKRIQSVLHVRPEKGQKENDVVHSRAWAVKTGFWTYPTCLVLRLLNWFSNGSQLLRLCPLLLLVNNDELRRQACWLPTRQLPNLSCIS